MGPANKNKSKTETSAEAPEIEEITTLAG